ncbi:ATP-binding cassette domain-containing protein [Streptococcus parauberis]|uniref:ABC transporter ATP-binding protein n=1 Tax=Streptococcus TaxID=1301 RepID=UPI00020CC037|nr:ATP-binding cassette domain-containing protein [Streptococcus parauberis]AEF25469.1 ABC transporter ATP-binding protein [Streptococcus parauberis KCTC 11537]KYP20979.1 putative ABC transporter ATP-binding protein YbbL [Streptococcus parauberis]KYP21363.1 putative ABC transporter ATP-binding protein YbbL [Streptococcus parauberis]KYP22241.1 putative ABC transporter ATP-binding protein YbbL [Streptococcus parauberis]KYP22985.1 putative ABC transporter ATP-binding protein YbbL [Streptococcus p
MSLISFNRVQFEVDNKNILNHVNFTVEEGDFLSIVGPSGSGKSTLLKLVSGLISPTKGEILFNGKDIAKQDPIETRKQLSYCFQTPYLFGSTVKDNLAFPFDIRHEEFNQSRVDQLFTLFQMDKTYLNQDVKKLSGGEKQRIALIRQLLFEPKVLLLDEVTSALDSVNKEIVEGVIQELHHKGMTILWITHDAEQSKKYANKLLTLVKGQIESLEVIK